MKEIATLSQKEARSLQLLLTKGKLSGLDIIHAYTGNFRRGTIYVTLDRMHQKGYIDSRQEPLTSPCGQPRRLFRATTLGSRVMAAREASYLLLAGGLA